MIKITHGILNNSTAAQAFTKLSRAGGMDAQTVYRIGRAHKIIQKEVQWGMRQALEILKKYAVLGDGLMPKNFPNGPFEFSDKSKEEAHDKEITDTVLNKEIEIPVHKVDVRKIPHGLLTGEDMLSLDWFLDGLDDLDEEQVSAIEEQRPAPKLWTPRPV